MKILEWIKKKLFDRPLRYGEDFTVQPLKLGYKKRRD